MDSLRSQNNFFGSILLPCRHLTAAWRRIELLCGRTRVYFSLLLASALLLQCQLVKAPMIFGSVLFQIRSSLQVYFVLTASADVEALLAESVQF
jgi:hypothetical protein